MIMIIYEKILELSIVPNGVQAAVLKERSMEKVLDEKMTEQILLKSKVNTTKRDIISMKMPKRRENLPRYSVILLTHRMK